MTDPINMSIGEAAPLSRRVFNDPLAFQGTALLVILVRGISEQHTHGRIKTGSRKTEQEKEEREEKRIPDRSSVEIIKGVYLEFKCRLILTLSPIYNHDLQGCHFSDVKVATASPVITASYPSRPLQIRSKQNITR